MNIFGWLFGDPSAQQAALDAQFRELRVQLAAARAAGDRAAEKRILRQMRQLAAKGSRLAQAHLQRVAKIEGTANAVKTAATHFGHSIKTIAIAAAIAAVAIAIARGR